MKTITTLVSKVAIVSILSVFMFVNCSGIASAITPEQKAIIDSGSLYFDEAESCLPVGSASSSSGAISGDIYMLGDSITVRTAPKYTEKMQAVGIVPAISAVVGRSWVGAGQAQGEGWQIGTTGPAKEAVQTDKPLIEKANAIVIALGTNGYIGSNPVNEIYDTVRAMNTKNAPIYWVNVAVSTANNGGVAPFNAELNRLQTEQKIKVIDWAKLVDPTGNGTANPSGILEDGIHPDMNTGTDQLSTLVTDSLKGSTGAAVAPVASGATGSIAPAGFNPDPKAVEMFTNDLLPKIQPLIPLYQKAAAEKGLADWQVLPALHNLEFGLRRDNPTTNTGFRTPFQMNANSLAKHGLDMSAPMFTPGHELTDDEFVTVAGYAAEFWLLSDAKYFDIDATQPMTPEQAAKIIVAYKSGAGSAWFNGKADFNLHAYAWAGFDTTPEHALPMAWGPGSPFGDEVAGTTVNKPGAATVFALLKGGTFSGNAVASTCNGNGGDNASSGTFTPVTGDKAEIVKKILASTAFKWGNYGNAATQKQDIENCLNDVTLKGILALAEQSGVPIPVNALATDHGGCNGGASDHNSGSAIDIGYYGNGQPNFEENGNTLYKFIYSNRQGLMADQVIWQEPPAGYMCLDKGQPVDCYTVYGTDTMNDHYHHIHVSFQ